MDPELLRAHGAPSQRGLEIPVRDVEFGSHLQLKFLSRPQASIALQHGQVPRPMLEKICESDRTLQQSRCCQELLGAAGS